MTPLIWTIVGIFCTVLCISLLLYAWRVRHQDVIWQRLMKNAARSDAKTLAHLAHKVPLPICCQVGVEELSRTTITGSWTCPSCGRFHTFVDGQPGKIDL